MESNKKQNTPSPEVVPGSFAAWMACCRPKTWAVSVSPVFAGLAVSLAETGKLSFYTALATLLLAILMQSISNMENDAGYTKRKAERGNRKGLPRATSKGWLTVHQVELGIKILSYLAIIDTIFLIIVGGWIMLLITLASIVAAYTYMGGPKPIAYTPFGELVVFIFFGLVAVCGTYYLQTGTVSWSAIFTAAAVGMLAAAVLAVNNYRDLEHDASVNRHTLAVFLGRDSMSSLYQILVIIPFALVFLAACFSPVLGFTLISFALLRTATGLSKQLTQKKGNELNGVMFGTIKLEVCFVILITIGAVTAHLIGA